MPDHAQMCRSCGGSGKMLGNPDAVSWCNVCGGSGLMVLGPSARRGGGSASTGGFLLGLAFLASLVLVPIAALVVVLDWFRGLIGPLRSVLEAVPGSGVGGSEGGGSAWTVPLVVGLLLLVLLVTLSVVHLRAVRASSSTAGDWKARGLGWLFALVLLVSLPAVLTTYAVTSGADLEAPASALEPSLTHWGFVVGVVGLVLVVGLLFTGRRFVRNADRVARRGGAAA